MGCWITALRLLITGMLKPCVHLSTGGSIAAEQGVLQAPGALALCPSNPQHWLAEMAEPTHLALPLGSSSCVMPAAESKADSVPA